MDPPRAPDTTSESFDSQTSALSRSDSLSSQDSQTAADFISSQLKLEADAREALPYKFDSCTKELGPLRQLVFACLTCNPPPQNPEDKYSPAGVCYSCSVQCHGEHELVELFNKRNFVCDCGSTRLPASSPCSLRVNPATNTAGDVHSEPAALSNRYNQNFRNRFCSCKCDYDPHQQKGTMFQCLGLGTVEDGGCGEDWYHPGCLVGLGPDWNEHKIHKKPSEGALDTIPESEDVDVDEGDEDEFPPGFPHEDTFDGFLCHKCVEANPWIKRYAGSRAFLAPVFLRSNAPSPETPAVLTQPQIDSVDSKAAINVEPLAGASDKLALSRKRKAKDDDDDEDSISSKRVKDEGNNENGKTATIKTEELSTAPKDCYFETLPPASEGVMSLFFQADFREQFCRCANCFPKLAKFPQLLEEEENYEPPVSESGDGDGASTVGSGSIYDRGESALKNVDRVRAIEGVMAYNHLKEKLTPFFKEFAESGKAISAEDIKAHFAKMRGDETAVKPAGSGGESVDNRREQNGY